MAEITLLGPLEIHGVKSASDYLRAQRREIARLQVLRPSVGARRPFASADRPDVFVSSGKWLVRCVCGNCPVVDLGWRLAACFQCGAIYQDLTAPENAAAIAAALTRRPNKQARQWTSSQTVDDLLQENMAMGVAPRGEEP